MKPNDSLPTSGTITVQGWTWGVHTRGATYLIAAYAYHSRATGRFYCKNKCYKTQKRQFQRSVGHSSAKTPYAHSAGLAGRKGLGRCLDRAWTEWSRTLHDQWNVATSAVGVTATARDINKSQIFIGGAGADTFTAGNAGDVILAGEGADTLNGGAGYDLLYGGNGADTYNFTGSFGSDKILDADGVGSLWVDNAPAAATLPTGSLFATYLIATHAFHSGATGRFDCEGRRFKGNERQSQGHLKCSNSKNAHAHSARLAGRKWLGRRMNRAWAEWSRSACARAVPNCIAGNEALQ